MSIHIVNLGTIVLFIHDITSDESYYDRVTVEFTH